MAVTYKCPNCGDAMEFNTQSQMLGCKRCGTQIDVVTYQQQYGNLMSQAQEGQNINQDQDYTNEDYTNQGFSNPGQAMNEYETEASDDVKMFQCSSCGAQLVADQYTSATFCTYCGNPTLVEERLRGKFKPNTIIPFKINKEQAVDTYKKWLKRGPLTPGTLSRSSTIEKINGIYVPFWLYDFHAESDMHAKCERVRTERHGNTEKIYTDHFQAYRHVTAEFERIPADASEKMPDDTMDKLEPYDYNELTEFQMPYLSGYFSERYNFTPEKIGYRAQNRANQYITDITKGTITGYSNVTVVQNNLVMQPKGSEYALFPVWMLNYRYNGKDYQFALNGQTGKIVADRPISMLKALAYGVGIFAASLAVTMIGGLIFL